MIKQIETKQRTLTQNAAMHLYYERLAKALNEAGYTMDVMAKIAPKLNTNWSGVAVKDRLWRPYQIAEIGQSSTTRLNKMQVSNVYMNLNLALSEVTGVSVPFPSIETMGL